MKAAYLVIDQGGHSTRALVYAADGSVLTHTAAPARLEHPAAERYEQTVPELELSVTRCLALLAQQLQQHSQARSQQHPVVIEAAALVTQRSSLLACRKDTLEPLTPIISWQDTRNQSWLGQQFSQATFDIATLQQRTGLRLNAHYGASKMRWLLDHDPLVQAAASENNLLFLPLAAFLAQRLTRNQHCVVDVATAARTFLCELGTQQWSPPLLELFQITRDCLPTIVPQRHAFGSMTLGDQTIPLAVVGGDQSFLPFAYGDAMRSRALFVNLGTGAFVQTLLPPSSIPEGLLCSALALDNQNSITVAEGTVNACASALDWFYAQHKLPADYTALERALGQIAEPPLFFHRISALGSPYWLPAGASTFSFEASKEAQLVAVVESVLFLLAINIDQLRSARGDTPPVFVSGGLSQSAAFCQKLANVCQLAVMRCEDHEASARGAAFFLAGVHAYPALARARAFQPGQDFGLQARYRQFCAWLKATAND